jgi:EpsI family protein
MITKRLAILFAVLVGGFGSVFLLPEAPKEQPVGIVLELPKIIGGWLGKDLEISEKERSVLGAETDFARKSYRNERGDEIQVSIVLSGHDMNTSIHRPERCLPAQGWTIADKKSTSIEIPDRGTLPMTRLLNLQPRRDADGKIAVTIFNLNYYAFIGHTDVTGSHFGRTFIDIRDRLLKGANQRWAYVTVAATITDNLSPKGLTEEETDKLVRDFIKQLIPRIIKDSTKLS